MSGAVRPWTIRPGALRAGDFTPPGDKSITHRAILLGGLASGETTIQGANRGADAGSSLGVVAALGATCERRGASITIRGTAGVLRQPLEPLDCGNSGTTLRLSAGIVAGAPIHAVLTGDDSLRRRPVDRVIVPLRAMGAHLRAEDHDRRPPLEIRGGGLAATVFPEPTPSAQVATCILFAGMSARGRTSVRTAAGVRDHTVHALRAFGIEVETSTDAHGVTSLAVIGPGTPRGAAIDVPGDPSAAAFFLAAAAATPGLRIEARGVNLNPARLGLLDCLREMGAYVEITPRGEATGEPVGDVAVTGPAQLVAADVPAVRVPSMVDEVPAWTIAAARARGTSRLAGAAELRVKESDRLQAIATNLGALGISAEPGADGLAITGGHARGGKVRAFGDHRIAMAFAILGSLADGIVEVDDAGAVATSFPDFESTFRARGGTLEAPAGAGSTRRE